MSSENTNLWNDNYKIDIKSLDDQHKKMFVLLDRLYHLDEEKDKKKLKIKLRKYLYELISFIQSSFKEEEEYMSSIKFSKLEEHIEMHKKIVVTLSNIIKSDIELHVLKSKMRLITKRILIKHITNEDIKIKLFLLQGKEEIKEEIFDLSHV